MRVSDLRPSAVSLALCAAAALSGCGPGEHAPPAGNAQFEVQLGTASLSSSVSKVTVTLRATDLTPFSFDLARTGTSWQGTLSSIKVGSNRNFHADAFASDGVTVLFSGDSAPVTISAGQTALVTMLLQQVNAPPVLTETAPIIDSLVLSSNDIAPGGLVTLTAAAHDVDPLQVLTYAWSAALGSFSPATGLTTSTVWTAPTATGPVTLTLTVTNQHNLSTSVSVVVTVDANQAQGSAQVTVTFNNWPVLSAMTPTPGTLSPGGTIALAAQATDADGDTIGYLWSSSCTGTFDSTVLATVHFTLPQASTDKSCTFSLAISDGRGGSGHGSLQLSVSSSIAIEVAPAIDSTLESPSTLSGPGLVNLQVLAHSPQGHALTYVWSSPAGTLGTQVDSAQGSSNTWTFTACAHATDTATVVISDAFGGSTTATFSLAENCP